MKKLHPFHIVLIIFSLGLFFTPKFEIDSHSKRSIASSTAIKEDLREILDFKFIDSIRDPKEVLGKIDKIYEPSKAVNTHMQVFLRDATKELPDDISYRLAPKITNEQYVLEILYNQKGLSDSAAAIELDTFIKHFIKFHYKTKFHFLNFTIMPLMETRLPCIL